MKFPMMTNEEIAEIITEEFKNAYRAKNADKLEEVIKIITRLRFDIDKEEIYKQTVRNIHKYMQEVLPKMSIDKFMTSVFSIMLHGVIDPQTDGEYEKQRFGDKIYADIYERVEFQNWETKYLKRQNDEKEITYKLAVLTGNKSVFDDVYQYYLNIKKPDYFDIRSLYETIKHIYNQVIERTEILYKFKEFDKVRDFIFYGEISKENLLSLQADDVVYFTNDYTIFNIFKHVKYGYIMFCVVPGTGILDPELEWTQIGDVVEFTNYKKLIDLLKQWLQQYYDRHKDILKDIDTSTYENKVKIAAEAHEVYVYETKARKQDITNLAIQIIKDHPEIKEYFYNELYTSKPTTVEKDVKRYVKQTKGRSKTFTSAHILIQKIRAKFLNRVYIVPNEQFTLKKKHSLHSYYQNKIKEFGKQHMFTDEQIKALINIYYDELADHLRQIGFVAMKNTYPATKKIIIVIRTSAYEY